MVNERFPIRSSKLLPLGTTVKIAAHWLDSDGAKHSKYNASTRGVVVLENWDGFLAVKVDGEVTHRLPDFWERA